MCYSPHCQLVLRWNHMLGLYAWAFSIPSYVSPQASPFSSGSVRPTFTTAATPDPLVLRRVSLSLALRIEHFFNFYSIPHEQKLAIAFPYMTGKALLWVRSSSPFSSWDNFRFHLRLRFGNPNFLNSSEIDAEFGEGFSQRLSQQFENLSVDATLPQSRMLVIRWRKTSGRSMMLSRCGISLKNGARFLILLTLLLMVKLGKIIDVTNFLYLIYNILHDSLLYKTLSTSNLLHWTFPAAFLLAHQLHIARHIVECPTCINNHSMFLF